MSKERIIPIQIEDDSNANQSSSSDSEQKLSESIEQLSVKQAPKTKQNIQVKNAPKENWQEEYLKKFDRFEDRTTILSDYTLPNANTSEKIVLVIDRAQDESFTPFAVNGDKYTPLSMVKRAVHIFIKLKLMINKNHEFAIVVLNENDAKMVLNFTSDIRRLKYALNKIIECQAEDIFDLNSLFDILTDQIVLPKTITPEIPPPYVVRTVIFYGRSYTVPQINATQEINNLLNNPYFTCDILMTHEPIETSNNCNKIFEVLQNLDKKGMAYFFPVCRDVRRLHKSTGKLLAHPLQRPIQKLLKN